MSSPQLCYPLRKLADSSIGYLALLPAACSVLIPLPTPVRMLRGVASTLRVRASTWTSPCPAKSPARPQSPRTTSLPSRAKPESCGTALAPLAIPLLLFAALHNERHYRKVIRRGPPTQRARHIRQLRIHQSLPAQSMFRAPYAGTTNAAGSRLRATLCGKSRSLSSTRRETASSPEPLSETAFAWYRPRLPDRSPSGT